MRPEELVIGALLVFCRIAACLMFVPGFSSARVPARVRLFLALAIATAISPHLADAPPRADSAVQLASLIVVECMVGFLIGMLARIYLAAIDFAGTAIANYIGLGGIAGAIDTDEPAPALATLLTMLTTLLLMILDFPQMMIVALVDSYQLAPMGQSFDARSGLVLVTSSLDVAFSLALKISAPFLAYGVILNLMFALLGKLVPQVPSFFISTPFIALGGLLLLYFAGSEILRVLFATLGAGLWRF